MSLKTKVNLLSLMTTCRQFSVCRLPSETALRLVHLHCSAFCGSSQVNSDLAQIMPFREWPGDDWSSLSHIEGIVERQP